MNKYIELEAKFSADSIPLSEFIALMETNKKYIVERVTVHGADTFYRIGDRVLRFRRINNRPYLDGDDSPRLTIKHRLTPGDITSRTEIEIPIDINKYSEEGTEAFLEILGAKEHFTLTKSSSIYRIETGSAIVDVVHYCVEFNGNIRHFVEVEVENSSPVTDTEAKFILGTWIRYLKDNLKLSDQLNTSLYEMYAPRDELFLPESF